MAATRLGSFYLLLVVIATMSSVYQLVDGSNCQPSSTYNGPCISNSNCNQICLSQTFRYGTCVWRAHPIFKIPIDRACSCCF